MAVMIEDAIHAKARLVRYRVDGATYNSNVEQSLSESGYAFVHAPAMREALESAGSLSDWNAFSESWDDLELEQYLAARERCRRRRYAVFTAGADGRIAREPHQPHYQ